MIFSEFTSIVLLILPTIAYMRSLPPLSLSHAPNATEYAFLEEANQEEFSNLTTHGICFSTYGRDMPADSCQDALAKIGHSVAYNSYIPRHRAPKGAIPPNIVPMPIRYLSDDGLCAIDVILTEVSRVTSLPTIFLWSSWSNMYRL